MAIYWKNWKHFVKKISVAALLFSYTVQLSAEISMPTIGLPVSNATAVASNPDANNQPPTVQDSNSLPTLGFTSDNLGLSGPFSFGGTYDTLLGPVFNGRYTQSLTNFMAISALGEYGADQYRINGTTGFQLYPQGLLKVSAEYLSQVLPFSFDSGDINQRVGQQAYGFDFQHNLNHAALKNLNFGGYWAKAPNVSLDTIDFMAADGYEYLNQRNLAGATSQGLSVGGVLALTNMTSLDVALNYDNVYYHTELTSNEQYNTQGMGGTLKLNQFVNDRMKFSVEASNRAIYNTYGADISYAPAFGDPLHFKFGLFMQCLVSSNDTPSSNTYGLQFSFLGDEPGRTHYRADDSAADLDLAQWVEDPAVYMQRVMMVAEQVTTLVHPAIASLAPSSGPIMGGNTVTLSGTNFFPATTVSFDGQPATVTYVSPQQLSVVVPALTFSASQGLRAGASFSRPVDVTVLNPDGQRAVFSDQYTYTLSEATITNVTPNSGTVEGGQAITITGTSFRQVTDVTFGGVSATNVSVNADGTSITCTTPAHALGVVDVVVQTPAGPVIASEAYTYETLITGLSPSSGNTPTPVTVSGSGFTGATAVTFGGTAGTSFTVVNDSTITAYPPAGSGTVAVVVIDATGQAIASPTEFTYTALVSGMSPSSGNSPTRVTLSGVGFTGATAVTFGGTAGTSFSVVNDSTITVYPPAGSTGGATVAVVASSGQSAVAPTTFTYITLPTCTKVVTSSLTQANPYTQPITVNFSMVGGGGGSCLGGGGGSSAILSGSTVISVANGGAGGNYGAVGSNGSSTTGSFSWPVNRDYIFYVGGGGGGGGGGIQSFGSRSGAGGASGYFGGGGSGRTGGGGGGSTTGGIGGAGGTGSVSGAYENGGAGALLPYAGSGGTAASGGAAGVSSFSYQGAGGGGGFGGGGGAGGFIFSNVVSATAGGSAGASAVNSSVATGGLGANTWASATTLPTAAGQGGTTPNGSGGNAGLIILIYTSPTSACLL